MRRRSRTLSWCLFLGLLGIATALELYDHEDIGKRLPNEDDVSSKEIALRVPIVFYGQTYTAIFVNSNGLLSFQTEIPTFFNSEFPLPYPIIAPLYSNVDANGTGTISYFETNSQAHLQRATNTVREAFTISDDFQASSLFVATWSSVGYHKNGVDKVNTFQVAISTDGDDSFVEFLYPQNGIQWIQGTGDESGLPDARAQAGFVSPDGRFYVLQGSGTDQVKYLDKWTNLNMPGHWIFRVGRVDVGSNVEEPDTFNEVIDTTPPKSCEKGSSLCHGFAKCIDYNEGFCCVCRPQYYGNGKFCVKKEVPVRANGKVTGSINGEILDNLDLQSYIVMADGRAYTAVSKIPDSINSDIQSLQILGGLLSWLFAKPIGDAINGFQLTGGVFNHTAIITFTNTNQNITITHKYLGLDVYDQQKLEVDIRGDIPRLSLEAKVTVSDYEENYSLTQVNSIRSTSSREFSYVNADGEDTVVPFTVDQTFTFDACKFNNSLVGTTWKLKSSRSFISYESREQIVRFGITSKVGPLTEHDPCAEGRTNCGINSVCIVESDSYKCVCNQGYQYIYRNNSNPVCEDINECLVGLHQCDYNAQCINVEGSYSCRCNPGFEGNGHTCESVQSCRNVRCPEYSQCVENGRAANCVCVPGYTGDGLYCAPFQDRNNCYYQNNCSPFGTCIENPQTYKFECICLNGYEGDGYYCRQSEITLPPVVEPPVVVTPVVVTTSSTEATETESIPTVEYFLARCEGKRCLCPEGYRIVPGSKYCVAGQETTTPEVITVPVTQITTVTINDNQTEVVTQASTSCSVLHNCDRNAQCVFEFSINSHLCVCNIGYEGDGYVCKEPESVCQFSSECDVHAACVFNKQIGVSTCVCDNGYWGNGRECKVARCLTNRDCPPNEDCVFSTSASGYECICKDDYVRDSQQICIKLAGTCGGGVCAENAECLYDEQYQTNYCSCKYDYIGDGITECRLRIKGCDEVPNCDRYATCVYDEEQQGYRCKCNEGFLGDGQTCEIERNCHTEPRLCHPYAVCVGNAERKYICECRPGYIGNGSYCDEGPRHEGNFLMVNQGKATLRVSLDPSPKQRAKLIHIDALQTAVGLDIDCLHGRVYWSDINGRSIKSSNYNGTNVTTFVNTDVGSPEGLTVDWVSRNVYWTDSSKDTIEVANIETGLRRTIFNTKLVNPRGIAVHPQRGKIFWADWNRLQPKIEWANADGTGREIFLESPDVQLPNSLAIDFETERLCYADAGIKKIECLDIDTRYKQTIAENLTYPFGVTVTSDHIFWSDWIIKKIERVDKRTLTRLPSLNVPLGGANKLYGIAAVPDRCLGLVNICQYYRHQCSEGHICLPNGGGSRTCACGYNINLPKESSTCTN